MLKLTLNVAEDEELRKYIKELVKGQVKSIVRSELFEMTREALVEKTNKTVSELDIRVMVRDMVKAQITREMSPTEVSKMAKEEALKFVRERIQWIQDPLRT